VMIAEAAAAFFASILMSSVRDAAPLLCDGSRTTTPFATPALPARRSRFGLRYKHCGPWPSCIQFRANGIPYCRNRRGRGTRKSLKKKGVGAHFYIDDAHRGCLSGAAAHGGARAIMQQKPAVMAMGGHLCRSCSPAGKISRARLYAGTRCK